MTTPLAYTSDRLRHATPEHLHLTSRRCFIGPVPIGWLRHHRREWYKHHLHINYSSRAAAFDAQPGTGRHRRLSNLEGSHTQRPSFPQPEDVEVEDERQRQSGESGSNGGKATTDEELALPIPRSSNTDRHPINGEISHESAGSHFAEDSKPAPSTQPSVGLSLDPQKETGPSTPKQQLMDGSKNQPPSARRRGTHRSAVTSKTSSKTAKTRNTRRGSGGALSFVTARTSLTNPDLDGVDEEEEETTRNDSINHLGNVVAEENASTAPLLKATSNLPEQPTTIEETGQPEGFLDKLKAKVTGDAKNGDDAPATLIAKNKSQGRHGPVRFNIPEDDVKAKEHYIRSKAAQFSRRTTIKRLRESAKDGEIVKIEKMLVRVEYTEHDLPDDFDENDSQKIDSRTLDKWKEFMIVCRECVDDDSEFVLQMYKTRVIKAIEETRVKKNSAYEVKLKQRSTRIGIFSSLDKTIVLWEPFKKGHRFYIMRPRSGADSMEWFTFIRNILGSDRANVLKVSVPDLKAHLILDHPFEELEKSEDLVKAVSGDDGALIRTMQVEQDVAQKIIRRCMEMLEQAPEWHDVIEKWTIPSIAKISSPATSTLSLEGAQKEQIEGPLLCYQPVGLAWKRYDRLEWVHGSNERQMYGTLGMERTHELELRPKQHYPTSLLLEDGDKMVEPPPVEGFLIRLTSQRGSEAILGRLFYKRLYFSTHNQFLVFNKPAQADPPPPPKLPMSSNARVHNSADIAEQIPLIYSINPYQLHDGKIAWLAGDTSRSSEEAAKHDLDALDESERVVNLLLKCDGGINLTHIRTVRDVHRGALQVDEHLDSGSDVDFHEDLGENNDGDDGTTKEFDDARTFELVLFNGLIIRLQAYNKTTKIEWQKRLRALIKYWKLREAADIALYRSVRQHNLDALNLDEDMEAIVGQFARKWEVSQSFASPELYNLCGICSCRSITMSGHLYRKPRMRGTFSRNMVILSHGHLMIFADTLRSLTGRKVPHSHHMRLTSLNLKDCYVYSGLITGNDLMYSELPPNSASRPGHYGLPRVFVEDGWSSTDEDTMTCFVVWHGKRTAWFRTDHEADHGHEHGRGHAHGHAQHGHGHVEKTSKRSKLKKVGQLGVEGKSVVFKARSRAERDHWVMNINMEIERLNEKVEREDVRIVEK